MEQTININPETDTLKILTGNAPKVTNLQSNVFEGNIYAPVDYAEEKAKHEIYDVKNSLAILDTDNLTATFIDNILLEVNQKVIGKLEYSKELKTFNINSSEEYGLVDFRELIRKNRIYFQTRETYDTLLAKLSKFSAQVQGSIGIQQDEKGNNKISLETAVQQELPSVFNLELPIFKSFPPEIIEVEINLRAVNQNTIVFYLESLHLFELVKERMYTIFEDIINRFKAIDVTVISK